MRIKVFSLNAIFTLIFGLSFFLLFLSEGPLRNNLFPADSIRYFIPSGLLIDDSWYKIMFNKTPVGYLHIFTKAGKNGGYLIKSTVSAKMPVSEKAEKLNLEALTELARNYSLRYAYLNLTSAGYFLKGELKKDKNGKFKLLIKSPSQNTSQYIDMKGKFVSSSFAPMVYNYIPLRQKTKISFFDPFLNKDSAVFILRKGRRTIMLNGKNIQALKFIVKSGEIEGEVYTDLRGRIVDQKILGFEFIKTNPSALFSKKFNRGYFDLTQAFSIPVSNIPNKERLKYLKIKVEGVDINSIPDTFSQSVNNKDSTIEVFKRQPAEIINTPIKREKFLKYLKETKFINFRSNEVGITAQKIMGKETNFFKIVKLMNAWINKNIKKVPTISVPESLTTLKLRQGDCGELSALLAGFLRSVGIPSYVNIGLVYENSKFFYHMWVSAFVGSWINVDPALGEDIADATHITLSKGLDNQLKILKFIGKIKIDIVDYGY